MSETTFNKCSLPKDTGNCKAYFKKFYFDKIKRSCQEFIYGGCGGNENRFDSEEECKKSCIATNDVADVCAQSLSIGNCKASIKRFYWNSVNKTCEKFTYSGCGANENNFETLAKCEAKCRLAPQTKEIKIFEDEVPDKNVCNLPVERGPCRALISRFYFDKTSGLCKKFDYGGCMGNLNNFLIQSECEQACKIPLEQDEDRRVCSLPVSNGKCKASMQRFYFDTLSKSCKKFTYTGCEANENNFETLAKCEKRCKSVSFEQPTTSKSPLTKDSINDVCRLPFEVGPCKSTQQRFYFDANSQTCKLFSYGGCQGNNNNFKTLNECETKCKASETTQKPATKDDINDACMLPFQVGPCKGTLPRFYFDASTQTCKGFTYGGCQGNNNNFVTINECESKCKRQPQTKEIKKFDDICTQQVKIGLCKAKIPRFYYNSVNNTCEKFHYSGCDGNDNNFESLLECENSCKQGEVVVVQKPMTKDDINDVCVLPFEVGPCRGTLPRYHFDASTQTCKEFLYGGCQGNGNNFDSKLQCETMCKKVLTTQVSNEEVDACKQPSEIGPCKAQIKRFYYDQASSTCKQFFYGGCKGNNNNFETLAKCEKQCKKNQVEEPDRTICQLKPDMGPCMSLMTRFFFDKASGSCLKFQYGGCQGNANNFETLSSCESYCKNIPQPREIKKIEA